MGLIKVGNIYNGSYKFKNPENEKLYNQAVVNAKIAQQEAKKLSSPLGMAGSFAKEFIKEIPKFTIQPVVRGATSLLSTFGEGISGKKQTYIPETKIEKILAGERPIGNISQYGSQTAEDFGFKKPKTELGGALVGIPMAIIDTFTTPASSSVKSIKAIAKEGKVLSTIIKELKNFKISKEVIKDIAPKLKNISDENTVAKIIKNAEIITEVENKVGRQTSPAIRNKIGEVLSTAEFKDGKQAEQFIKKLTDDIVESAPKESPLIQEARKLPRGYKQFSEPIAKAEQLRKEFPNADIQVFGSTSQFKRAPLKERQARHFLGTTKSKPDLDIIVNDPEISKIITSERGQVGKTDLRTEYIDFYKKVKSGEWNYDQWSEFNDRLFGYSADDVIFKVGNDYYKPTEVGLQYFPANSDFAKNLSKSKPIDDVISQFNKVKSQPLQEVDPLIQEARKYKSAEEFVKAQPTVYHGTTKKFDTFDVEIGGQDGMPIGSLGTFFTDQKFNAKNVVAKKTRSDIKPIVKEVVLDFKKPKIYEEKGFKSGFTQLIDDIEKNGKMWKEYDTPSGYKEIPNNEPVKKFRQQLLDEGYDGIIIKGGNPADGIPDNQWVALKNDVIKTKSQLIDIWNKSQPLQEGARKVDPLIQEGVDSLPKKILTDKGAEIESTKQYLKKLVDDSAQERKALEESFTGGQTRQLGAGDEGFENYGGSINLRRFSEHSPEYRDYFKKHGTKPPLSFYRNIIEKEIAGGTHPISGEYKAVNDFLKTLGGGEMFETVPNKLKIESEISRHITEVKSKIGLEMHTKNISKETVRRVSKAIGISEWKNATKEQAEKVLDRLKAFKEGDRLPTDKQLVGLKSLYPDKDFVGKTVREIAEAVGAGDDPLSSTVKKLVAFVEPITRTKRVRGEMLKKVLDNVQYGEQMSFIRKKAIVDMFDKNLKLAYKGKGLFESKSKVWSRVFDYLDTGKGELSKGEKKLADFMKSYFQNAKQYLVDNGDMARGRTFYAPHRAAELKELIGEYGLLDGINKWNKNRKLLKGDAGLPADIWVNLDNIMGTNKFFKFALQRTGVLAPSKNVERIFKEYMSLFETKRFLDKVLPQIHAAANVLTPPSGNTAKWLMQYGKQLKGRQYSFIDRAIDKAVSFNFFAKLGFRHISAMKNLIGGETNNFIQNGFLRQMLGKKRLFTQPFKSLDIVNKYGFLNGDYVDVAQQGIINKTIKGVSTAAFFEQKLVEMEIRASQVVGLLSHKEFKTGQISSKRLLEIMDNLEITQGVYTAARSPLAVKTPYGRAALQFSRWVLTDTAMLTSIVKGAFRGNDKAKNMARLARTLTAFVVGGYMAEEFGKAGYDKAKQYAETLQEPIKATIRALDGELATQAVADNPSLQIVSELNYSLKWLSWKMGAGNMPQTFEIKKGITETYLAPKRQLEEFGILESDTAYGVYKQLKNMKADDANKKLAEIKKSDQQRYTLIQKYLKWDKLKLTAKEREFAKMTVKDGQRAKAINKYIMSQSNRNETYERLKASGILTDEVKRQIISIQKEKQK